MLVHIYSLPGVCGTSIVQTLYVGLCCTACTYFCISKGDHVNIACILDGVVLLYQYVGRSRLIIIECDIMCQCTFVSDQEYI